MSGFVQLPPMSVHGDWRHVASIRTTPEELAQRCGVEWPEAYEDDGLGPAVGAIFRASNGEVFGIENHPLSAGTLGDRNTTISTLFDPERNAETLDAALGDLELTTADVTWLREDIRFTPHDLIRQDDHGNQFSVGTYSCRADARAAEREFRKSFHKQEYWIVPAKP